MHMRTALWFKGERCSAWNLSRNQGSQTQTGKALTGTHSAVSPFLMEKEECEAQRRLWIRVAVASGSWQVTFSGSVWDSGTDLARAGALTPRLQSLSDITPGLSHGWGRRWSEYG